MGMEPLPSRPGQGVEASEFSHPMRRAQKPEHGHRAIDHGVHPGLRQSDAAGVRQKRAQPGAFLAIGLRHPPAPMTQPVLQIAENTGAAIELPMQKHQRQEDQIEKKPTLSRPGPAQNNASQNADMDQKTDPAQDIAFAFHGLKLERKPAPTQTRV